MPYDISTRFFYSESYLHIKGEDGIKAIQSSDYFSQTKKLLCLWFLRIYTNLFSKALALHIKLAAELKALEVDGIACLAVNDAHAAKAWGDAEGATGERHLQMQLVFQTC